MTKCLDMGLFGMHACRQDHSAPVPGLATNELLECCRRHATRICTLLSEPGTQFRGCQSPLHLRLHLVDNCLGVPLGAAKPNQLVAVKSLRPASAPVGVSGSAASRPGAVTSSALTLPPLTCAIAVGDAVTSTST